jgi:hypothetical protein
MKTRATLPLDFLYAPNGNQTKDLDRNINTIKYNLLNLPNTIQFYNGNEIVQKYNSNDWSGGYIESGKFYILRH